MPELEPDLERQATHSIRGYAYQCYQTIKAWLHCKPGEELRCEFAEDFDLVRRDLDKQVTEAELNQVKHEKKNITLNSEPATQLINNFFRHKSRNPGLRLKIRLCTISDRGREKQVDWSHASCGMDLWDRLKRRELTGLNQAAAIAALRSHLRSSDHISSEVKSFLETSDDSTFLSDFIDQISWDTGQLSYVEIEQEIRRLLAERERPIIDALEVRQAIDRLWRHVMDLLATDSDRTLKCEDRERILSEETTARIDRNRLNELVTRTVNIEEIDQRITKIEQGMTEIVKSMAPNDIQTDHTIQVHSQAFALCGDLPSLPSICSPRSEVLEDVSSKYGNKVLLWIYGSAGYGKTTLTNLLIRKMNTEFRWFRLRNVVEFELLSSLGSILARVRELSQSERVIIVLDDISLRDTDTSCLELIERIAEAVKERNSLLVVNSQGFAPSRLSSLLGDQLIACDMPAMSIEEITALLLDAGLNDQDRRGLWTAFIQARTQGHPQLVGAYVTYAKEIGWRFSPEEFVSTPQTAETVKRESRKLLAETIHSAEARELAKRLSIVNISFPRDFALALGRANPSLAEPGHAFDSLLGPWIEVLDNNQYSLSPLLDGYAASEVGQAGLIPFYRMAAYAWFLQKNLNQFQFLQLVTNALGAKEEFLIGHTAYVVVTMKRHVFEMVSKELSLLCLIALDEDGPLKELKPFTRYLFRKAQLRIAEQNGQSTMYKKIDTIILAELEVKQNEPLFRNLLFTHYVETCIAKSSPIALKERIRRSIRAVEFVQSGLIEPDFIEPLDANIPIGSLFILATYGLDDSEDLEYLIGELEQKTPDVVQTIFSAFAGYSEALSLLIDRVWLSESKKQIPKWDELLVLFSRVMDFAKTHNLPWLFAGAARGKMVIFDEYLNSPQAALQVSNEARASLGETHPLIDLAESTVNFRGERYDTSLELFDKLDQNLPLNELAIERIFALRRAIIASSKTLSWDKVKKYAARGLQLVDSLPDPVFAKVAKIAFEAETGWADHEKGDRISAVEEFQAALTSLESFSDQKHPLFHILRLRYGHMLGWLSQFTKHNTPSSSGQPADSNRPFCGMFANFEDPPIESLNRPGVPYEGCWGMLSKYVAWHMPKERVKSYADRALAVTPKGQWYLAVWIAREALFANDLAEKNFDAALNSGLEYVRSEVAASALREEGEERWDISGYGNFDSNELSPEVLNKWIHEVPYRVFEPILMTLCSTDHQPQIDFNNWRNILTQTFGANELIRASLELLEVGLKATVGNAEATTRAKDAAWDTSGVIEVIQRLAQIICCASKHLHLTECIGAQASFLLRIPTPLHDTVYAHAFTRMVAKRWIYLAEQQRFLLGSPRLFVPAISEAAASLVPTVSECANLILVVGNALQLRWPADMLEKLKALVG